jgi:glucose/arabinose dehydrogenase
MSSRRLALVVSMLFVAALGASAADPVPGVRIVDAWQGVTFEKPLWVGAADDGSDNLYVAEQKGRIVRIPKWRGGEVGRPTPFLDLTAKVATQGQGGIAGVAFHPKFRENGRLFVTYLAKHAAPPFKIVLAEYKSVNGVCEPGSEKILFEIPKTYPQHNGGGMEFGADGKLWIGTGDNREPKEAIATSQNPQSLLGKLLRIDVDAGAPYGIPAGNPWPNAQGVRPEIWATGFRNAWRFCFDPQGAPWIASPGRKDREWVTRVTAGGNGGWPFRDGSQANPDVPVPPAFAKVQFLPPAFEYLRSGEDDTTAMVGGYFYRGDRIKALKGQYVFGDYARGKIYAISVANGVGSNMREVGDVNTVSSLGQDVQGELYFCSIDDGRVFTLAPQ